MTPYRTPSPKPRQTHAASNHAALLVGLLFGTVASLIRVAGALVRREVFTAEPTIALLAAVAFGAAAVDTLRAWRRERSTRTLTR